MAADKGVERSMTSLGYYYEQKEKNYDEMKKYYKMAIAKGSKNGLDYLLRYYKMAPKVDFSFIELFDYYADNESLIWLMNNKLKQENSKFPKHLYQRFCNLNIINNDRIDNSLKNIQYILKMTNIFPSSYYNSNHMIRFMELLYLCYNPKCFFSKDIMMKIGGHLFS
jgi:TPR repeat protein